MKLYKYFTIAENLKKTLSSNTIYLPERDKLNDPFESIILFKDTKLKESIEKEYSNNWIYKNSEIQSEDIYNLSKSYLDELTGSNDYLTEYEKKFSEIKNGIFSMTTENDNLLLWSYYGNSHEGICIEYEVPESLLNIKVYKVNYKDRKEKIELQQNDKEIFKEKFYTKSYHWKHENEYRYIDKNHSQEIPCPFTISKFFLGMKITQEDFDCIKNIRNSLYQKVELYQAKRINDQYEIDYDKL